MNPSLSLIVKLSGCAASTLLIATYAFSAHGSDRNTALLSIPSEKGERCLDVNPDRSADSVYVAFPINASRLSSDAVITLDNLAQRICTLGAVNKLSGISITGAASIDGSTALNKSLSSARAVAVKNYLDSIFLSRDSVVNIPSSDRHLSSIGEDWTRFTMMIEEDNSVPDRSEVLEIAKSSASLEDKERRLRALSKSWSYLKKHIFPALRSAYIEVNWVNLPPERECVSFENSYVDDSTMVVDTVLQPLARINPVRDAGELPGLPLSQNSSGSLDIGNWTRNYYIKTNLPAWLCLWTNLECEADIAPHWSAEVALYYSGFNYFTRTLKYRTFTLMPEVRYWLKNNNDGFFTGVHFGMHYFNIALDGEIRYQDHDGKTPALGGGLTLGYRFPLRNPRWKMEFSAGTGVYYLDYDMFENCPNGRLVGRNRRIYYGLDRFAVSLCYTFGNEKRKGGSP